MLGLPESVRACLFDLDGVLTQTAKVHAAAWKEMFDGFLGERAAKGGDGRSVVRLVVFLTLERTMAIELALRRP